MNTLMDSYVNAVKAVDDSYVNDCPICFSFVSDDKDRTNIIYESDLFIVAINPRWSPHLGRCAVIPKRHLGDDGRYGVFKLGEIEALEYNQLVILTRDAIDASFLDFGIKEREGHPLIDYLVRPSVHPSGDLFPTYESAVHFMGYMFPEYEGVGIKTNSMPQLDEDGPAILASFPKTNANLTMPADLRQAIVDRLKFNFDYDRL